jgi:hypothetical protein
MRLYRDTEVPFAVARLVSNGESVALERRHMLLTSTCFNNHRNIAHPSIIKRNYDHQMPRTSHPAIRQRPPIGAG